MCKSHGPNSIESHIRKTRSGEREGGGDVEMTIYELRQAVSEYAIMWIQKDDGEYCEANESRYLSHKWDGEAVKTMYPEKYHAFGYMAITVVI